mmetsp:Transcript_30333/g.66387  ORF Transcript_30333/g.66387 Transcript_30333/m.66387 type:complete len:235 (+) Transcript_30333:436-1140(+)
MLTWLFLHLWICTVLLIILIRFSTSASFSSSTKSVLFSNIRSAKATCSTASFSTPSGFSSSRRSMICLASTTVRMPSNSSLCCTKLSAKKVWATGAGSARPVVSITMPSSGFPSFSELFTIFFRPAMRSPRTVQQMQPLFISTRFSSVSSAVISSKPSSMPTSPNSFSMTAMRLPWFSLRMRFNSVVLPLPKKPVITVTGTLSAFRPPRVAAAALVLFSASASHRFAATAWAHS